MACRIRAFGDHVSKWRDAGADDELKLVDRTKPSPCALPSSDHLRPVQGPAGLRSGSSGRRPGLPAREAHSFQPARLPALGTRRVLVASSAVLRLTTLAATLPTDTTGHANIQFWCDLIAYLLAVLLLACGIVISTVKEAAKVGWFGCKKLHSDEPAAPSPPPLPPPALEADAPTTRSWATGKAKCAPLSAAIVREIRRLIAFAGPVCVNLKD